MNEQESAKDLAFYSAVLGAWIETRMEKDKTLLTLSTGGIGVLTTLATTVGPSSKAQLALYALACGCFAVAVITGILVFDRNSKHLDDIIRKQAVGTSETLTWLDRLLFGGFVLGVLLTGAIAILAGVQHLLKP